MILTYMNHSQEVILMIKIIYAMMDERLPEGFEDNLVFGPGEYEIMLFEVPVMIEVDGVMETWPEYTCILYRPGQRIHYHAVSGDMLYNWIRFDCDEPLYTENFLPYGKPVICPDYGCYITYWRMVANENYWQYNSSDYVNEQLMHIIFHRLHDYTTTTDFGGYRDAFMDLRNQIYQYPADNWTLEKMASIVNLSTRSLQKFYKSFFHVSCINEVINSRITYAKFLLTHSSDNIQEIAEKSGYNNMEHFCRQFKKTEGCTPSKYRRQSIAASQE